MSITVPQGCVCTLPKERFPVNGFSSAFKLKSLSLHLLLLMSWPSYLFRSISADILSYRGGGVMRLQVPRYATKMVAKHEKVTLAKGRGPPRSTSLQSECVCPPVRDVAGATASGQRLLTLQHSASSTDKKCRNTSDRTISVEQCFLRD